MQYSEDQSMRDLSNKWMGEEQSCKLLPPPRSEDLTTELLISDPTIRSIRHTIGLPAVDDVPRPWREGFVLLFRIMLLQQGYKYEQSFCNKAGSEP